MKAKIRILTRRIKRSYKKDREQWIKGGILTVILLVIVIFAGSCACGKKTVKAPDAESQGLMKITPIPTATPTPVPRQVNKDAVAQSGSVTMVNEYLVQKEEGKATGSKSSSSEEQTAADSSDSSGDATGNSTDEETETGSGD